MNCNPHNLCTPALYLQTTAFVLLYKFYIWYLASFVCFGIQHFFIFILLFQWDSVALTPGIQST